MSQSGSMTLYFDLRSISCTRHEPNLPRGWVEAVAVRLLPGWSLPPANLGNLMKRFVAPRLPYPCTSCLSSPRTLDACFISAARGKSPAVVTVTGWNAESNSLV